MNSLFSIQNLTIKNFKCYGDKTPRIDFGKSLTIIIGKNGAGKTALLNALKKVCSIILARDRRRNMNFIGDSLNIHQNTLKISDAHYNFELAEGGEDYEFPVRLDCCGTMRGEGNIKWHVEKISKGDRSVMTFREALDKFLIPFNDETSYPSLPVLCFFSDCFPHVRNDISKYEKDILYNKASNPERRAGYYHWDDDNSDFNFWSGLFINAYKRVNDTITGVTATENLLASNNLKNREVIEKRLDSLKRDIEEINYISSFLKRFTQPLSDYDTSAFEIEYLSVGHYLNDANKDVDAIKIAFTNGETRYFNMLPEGYKRLLSIAFEIAYRHYVLNRKLIIDDPQFQPEGIVIIDEIELHLHPSLSEEAIARLRKTYPNIQFIVTTHSPTVISNVYNDGDTVRVIRLTDNHQFMLAEDCFEADYSDTLVIAMGAYNSMRYTQKLRQHYLNAIHENDEAEINKLREELTSFIGRQSNPEKIVTRIIEDWNNYV